MTDITVKSTTETAAKPCFVDQSIEAKLRRIAIAYHQELPHLPKNEEARRNYLRTSYDRN